MSDPLPYSPALDVPYSERFLHMIRGIEPSGYVLQRTQQPGVWVCRREPTPDGVWFRPEGGRLRLLPALHSPTTQAE